MHTFSVTWQYFVHSSGSNIVLSQITMVPSGGFWSSMEKLQLLHLHDNPIGRIENLHYLAACPSLSVLTLYDTALSLKRNYR